MTRLDDERLDDDDDDQMMLTRIFFCYMINLFSCYFVELYYLRILLKKRNLQELFSEYFRAKTNWNMFHIRMRILIL
jgi:hypothetical protein